MKLLITWRKPSLVFFVGIMALACCVCTGTAVSGQTAGAIKGTWVRERDAYQGWVIEIAEVRSGQYEAKTLWATSIASNLYGFHIGEKKLQNIQGRKDGTFQAESLTRTEDSSPVYVSVEISMPHPDRLIILADHPSGNVGDKQVYRRITSNDDLNAYVDYGRGVLLAQRERFHDAAKMFVTSTERLLQVNELEQHRDLANNLAWILATSQQEEFDQPKLALELVPALLDWFQNIDTAAAVYAANGDFSNALKWQEQAVEQVSSANAAKIYLKNIGAEVNNPLLLMVAKMVVAEQKEQFLKRKALYLQRRAFRD